MDTSIVTYFSPPSCYYSHCSLREKKKFDINTVGFLIPYRERNRKQFTFFFLPLFLGYSSDGDLYAFDFNNDVHLNWKSETTSQKNVCN